MADRLFSNPVSAQRPATGQPVRAPDADRVVVRDLKSHRYGQGFEDSLTRSGGRLQILLLVGTLASFASWLAAMGCEATGIAQWLLPIKTKRKLYSTLRVGREALVRRWPMEPVSKWLDRLRSLSPAVLNQMVSPA